MGTLEELPTLECPDDLCECESETIYLRRVSAEEYSFNFKIRTMSNNWLRLHNFKPRRMRSYHKALEMDWNHMLMNYECKLYFFNHTNGNGTIYIMEE